MNKPPYIVTLAQLALMPIGTLVMQLKTSAERPIQFDCQGYLQVGPLHRLRAVGENWLDIKPVFPDLTLNDGVLEQTFAPSSFYRAGEHPHRFVVYDKDSLKNLTENLPC